MDVRPLSPAVGAELIGVDLARADSVELEAVRHALNAHGVVFARDQKLDADGLVALARRFGPPEVHPIVEGTDAHPELIEVLKPAGQRASFGTGWHTDNSFFERPSLGSLLYALEVPPCGGDTLYARTEAAYEALSPTLRAFLDPLQAVHSASRAYDPGITGEAKYRGEAPLRYRWDPEAIYAEVTHPVVRTHPETGRRGLYVNPMFTQHIVGLSKDESQAVLALLYAHVAKPEFGCRLVWSPGTLALWDNRSVWHNALDDYPDHARRMLRVTIEGDRPR